MSWLETDAGFPSNATFNAGANDGAFVTSSSDPELGKSLSAPLPVGEEFDPYDLGAHSPRATLWSGTGTVVETLPKVAAGAIGVVLLAKLSPFIAGAVVVYGLHSLLSGSGYAIGKSYARLMRGEATVADLEIVTSTVAGYWVASRVGPMAVSRVPHGPTFDMVFINGKWQLPIRGESIVPYQMGALQNAAHNGVVAYAGSVPRAMTPALLADAMSAAELGCFVAGTLVDTETGFKRIETIHVGERVWAYHEGRSERGLYPVVRTSELPNREVLRLQIGSERIQATTEHPFYVEGKSWVAACKLIAGDKIWTAHKRHFEIVCEVYFMNERATVYNFEVQDAHTYYITNARLLVHNTSKPPDQRDSAGKIFTRSDGHAKGVQLLRSKVIRQRVETAVSEGCTGVRLKRRFPTIPPGTLRNWQSEYLRAQRGSAPGTGLQSYRDIRHAVKQDYQNGVRTRTIVKRYARSVDADVTKPSVRTVEHWIQQYRQEHGLSRPPRLHLSQRKLTAAFKALDELDARNIQHREQDEPRESTIALVRVLARKLRIGTSALLQRWYTYRRKQSASSPVQNDVNAPDSLQERGGAPTLVLVPITQRPVPNSGRRDETAGIFSAPGIEETLETQFNVEFMRGIHVAQSNFMRFLAQQQKRGGDTAGTDLALRWTTMQHNLRVDRAGRPIQGLNRLRTEPNQDNDALRLREARRVVEEAGVDPNALNPRFEAAPVEEIAERLEQAELILNDILQATGRDSVVALVGQYIYLMAHTCPLDLNAMGNEVLIAQVDALFRQMGLPSMQGIEGAIWVAQRFPDPRNHGIEWDDEDNFFAKVWADIVSSYELP